MSTSPSAGGRRGREALAGKGRGAGERRRPAARNHLLAAERRRLLWRVGPPALVLLLVAGWCERTWLRSPPPPEPPQVDTRLPGHAPGAAPPDAVRIGAAGIADESVAADGAEGADPVPDGLRGADDTALARVRDDTLFRSDDEPAWSELCRSLAELPRWPPDRARIRPSSYADLHGQSRALRGRMVGFRGVVRRLVPVEPSPERDGAWPKWQAWVEPDGGPPTPIVVYFLELPEGMPSGARIAETVDVAGYFFKRWAYQATDAVRTAPLVISRAPRWQPRAPAAPGGHPWGSWGLVAMTGLMVATWLGISIAAREPRRRPPPPPPDWQGFDAGDAAPVPAIDPAGIGAPPSDVTGEGR